MLKTTLMQQTETFKKDMFEKWDEQSEIILDKLKVQELRMQDIEMR